MTRVEVVWELINHPNRPDAFFAAGDRLTTISMTLVKKAGLRIPEDIAILGFTNLVTVHLLNPKTINEYETKKLETKLEIRASTIKSVSSCGIRSLV